MNYWDLKWQERHQLQCDGLEDVKSPFTLAVAELLEGASVEALELVRPRWRNAEMYLKNLSTSLPHSLGGFEPDSRNNDDLSRQYSSKFGDSVYHNVALPEYEALPEYRHPPPEYRIVPSLILVYPYRSQVAPSSPSPHFFEFPHITRHPVPSTLPLPSSFSVSGRDLRRHPKFLQRPNQPNPPRFNRRHNEVMINFL
ncbi:hypothetical protein BU15DRAFT_78522 [Melanogaster broomeanus]|nr:hypothetical protein BU15DRAFT_78522 [Melanogaster broomeanus]